MKTVAIYFCLLVCKKWNALFAVLFVHYVRSRVRFLPLLCVMLTLTIRILYPEVGDVYFYSSVLFHVVMCRQCFAFKPVE